MATTVLPEWLYVLAESYRKAMVWGKVYVRVRRSGKSSQNSGFRIQNFVKRRRFAMKRFNGMMIVAIAVMVANVGWGAGNKEAPKEGSAGGVGLTAKIGTLGLGLEATVGASDYLGFRFGINGMSAGPTVLTDEGSIDTDMEWLSYGALVDIHPFGGGFRLSGGGLINKNKFKMNADMTEPVDLNGVEYYLSDLSGSVTFEELAPYAGIGFGNAVGADGRWHFSFDLGVMFQGTPKVEASATASDPSIQGVVDDALAAEVADIQEKAENFTLYPVISIGLSYRF
jgi:hypothetical protein